MKDPTTPSALPALVACAVSLMLALLVAVPGCGGEGRSGSDAASDSLEGGTAVTYAAKTLSAKVASSTAAGVKPAPLMVEGVVRPVPLMMRQAVLVASPGVFESDAPQYVEIDYAGHFAAAVQPRSALTPGRYVGSIDLQLCDDLTCQQRVPVYGSALHYELNVEAAPMQVAYSVPTVAASFLSNDQAAPPAPIDVAITLANLPKASDGAPYVYLQPDAAVLDSTEPVAVSADASGRLLAHLAPKHDLPPGHYQGRFAVNVCADAACTQPYATGGAPLAYDFTVADVFEVTASIDGRPRYDINSGRPTAGPNESFTVDMYGGSTVELHSNLPATWRIGGNEAQHATVVGLAVTDTTWRASLTGSTAPYGYVTVVVQPKNGAQYATEIQIPVK